MRTPVSEMICVTGGAIEGWADPDSDLFITTAVRSGR